MLEAVLSRGDRRLGAVIRRAWQLGTKFDAWQEHHDHAAWMQAFADAGIAMAFYTHRTRTLDEVFPWDHIDIGVKKSYLAQDYAWSGQGQTRVDCRDHCFACGILPGYTDLRSATPPEAWKCPPVLPRAQRGKTSATIIPITSL